MIKRVAPKFRRNDPAQLALVARLASFSDEQVEELEAAMEEYVLVGRMSSELSDLLHPCEGILQEAA